MSEQEITLLTEFTTAARALKRIALKSKRSPLKMHFHARAEVLGMAWKAYTKNEESPYFVDALLTAWGA